MNEIIQQYKENKEEIKNIYGKIDNAKKLSDKKIYDIKYDIYETTIRELQKQRDEEIEREEQDFQEIELKFKEDICRLDKLITKIERILELINISEKRYDTNLEVYTYSDKDEQGNYISDRDEQGNYISNKRKIILNPIEILQDDEFKKIAVYIVDNGKPKNKFSLIVRGMSIFAYSDKLGLNKYRYGSYISGLHEERCNIEITLKDLPTQEELINWYAKNKEGILILKNILEEQKQLEEEYKEALKLYGLKDWKILYWENQKEYYEKHYSRGVETEGYKKVLKNLEKLKNENR